MAGRASGAFFLLIAAQAAHSAEEYLFRLYDRFAPARAASEALGPLGLERPAGFLAVNAALILFGLWCWLARVRPARGAWRGLAWFWILLEAANAIGHFALAALAGGYFPGVATAPLLLAAALWLAVRLRPNEGT